MDFIFEILPLILLLLCLGAVAGFLAGLLGVGGGIVLVPGLFYVFESIQADYGFDAAYLMHLSVATSLAIIVPTGFSSAYSHYKRESVDFHLVRTIGGGIVVGVVLASWIASGLDAQSMKIIFASAIMILAIVMIMGRARFAREEEAPFKPIETGIAGIVIGCISALIGIGGATLSVPYMSIKGVKMHRAVGTASALGLVIAVPATLSYIVIGWHIETLPLYSLGFVNILAWACIIPMSVAIAPLGARAAHRVSVKKLKITFAVFMVLVALNMWRKVLMGS